MKQYCYLDGRGACKPDISKQECRLCIDRPQPFKPSVALSEQVQMALSTPFSISLQNVGLSAMEMAAQMEKINAALTDAARIIPLPKGTSISPIKQAREYTAGLLSKKEPKLNLLDPPKRKFNLAEED